MEEIFFLFHFFSVSGILSETTVCIRLSEEWVCRKFSFEATRQEKCLNLSDNGGWGGPWKKYFLSWDLDKE